MSEPLPGNDIFDKQCKNFKSVAPGFHYEGPAPCKVHLTINLAGGPDLLQIDC